MPPPQTKKIEFVYSGRLQSLRSQYNAFKAACPNPPTAVVTPHPVDNDYGALVGKFTGLMNNAAVLVAAGGPVSALAARAATQGQPPDQRTPVVFTSVTDPVGSGVYKGGDNITGIAGMTTELDLARLRLLQQLGENSPIDKIGVLLNPNRPGVQAQFQKLKDASGLGNNLVDKYAGTQGVAGKKADIEKAVQELLTSDVKAILVTADPFFNDHRDAVTKSGNPPRPLSKPAIYQWSEFVVEDGGLMSFGPNLVEEYAAAGRYVTLILAGKLPKDIPLHQPINFEFHYNRATAKALRLEMPKSLLAHAQKRAPL